jgi:hypothetical protein
MACADLALALARRGVRTRDELADQAVDDISRYRRVVDEKRPVP